MTPAGVDVIVPCYNYGRYLQDCVESVLRERRLPIRLLIIDDASADGSLELAREIAAADSRVTVVSHATNRGHIATYNEGIDWVRQPNMLLLSADDMVAPGALVRAAGLLEARPELAFVHGRAIRFREAHELPEAPEAASRDLRVWRGLDYIRERCVHPVNPVETPTVVVRTQVQKQVGGYSPELPHAGDFEMWLRCAAFGDVADLDAVQGYVRMHDSNMRRAYSGTRVLEDYRQRQVSYTRFFREHGHRTPGAAELQRLAMRSLATDLLWEASRAIEAGEPAADMIDAAREMAPQIRWSSVYLRLALKRRLWPLRGRLAAGPPASAAAA